MANSLSGQIGISLDGFRKTMAEAGKSFTGNSSVNAPAVSGRLSDSIGISNFSAADLMFPSMKYSHLPFLEQQSRLREEQGLDLWGVVPPKPVAVERETYQVAQRPLDKFSFLYSGNSSIDPLGLKHTQFVSSTGENFGMTKGDGDKKGVVTSENSKFTINRGTRTPDSKTELTFDSPRYGRKKYDAELIRAARKNVEKKWEGVSNVLQDAAYYGIEEDFEPERYNLLGNNCQLYVREVIHEAERLAAEKGVPLVIN